MLRIRFDHFPESLSFLIPLGLQGRFLFEKQSHARGKLHLSDESCFGVFLGTGYVVVNLR